MNGVCPLDLVPMATKYSLQKDALEEACQELPQHFNSQSEQWINTATDSTAQAKNVCKQHQEVTDGLLLFKIEKVHSSFKHILSRKLDWVARESHLLMTANKRSGTEELSFSSQSLIFCDCVSTPHSGRCCMVRKIFSVLPAATGTTLWECNSMWRMALQNAWEEKYEGWLFFPSNQERVVWYAIRQRKEHFTTLQKESTFSMISVVHEVQLQSSFQLPPLMKCEFFNGQ